MSNFDFLTQDEKFHTLAETAQSAEKIFSIDTAACVINCRRTMEFALKWLYNTDSALGIPYDDKLITMLNRAELRNYLGKDLVWRLDFIRKIGNMAAHEEKAISDAQAIICLENLYLFLKFLYQRYSNSDFNGVFDKSAFVFDTQVRDNICYIEAMLDDAGWKKGTDYEENYNLPNASDDSMYGYVDYILKSEREILGIIETKKTCEDIEKGRVQASAYADLIQKLQGFRPFIFITDGFEIFFNDGHYPERKISSLYSQADLMKLKEKFSDKQKTVGNTQIIFASECEKTAFDTAVDIFHKFIQRKILFSMNSYPHEFTAAVKISNFLKEQESIQNILYLAANSKSAGRIRQSLEAVYPENSISNNDKAKDQYHAEKTVCTMKAMASLIDSIEENHKKLFTAGHFDLIIIFDLNNDIFLHYRDLIQYFDGLILAFTNLQYKEISEELKNFFDIKDDSAFVICKDGEKAQEKLCEFKLSETAADFLDKMNEAVRLQDISCQTDELAKKRKHIVKELAAMVSALDKTNFAVFQHLKTVEYYSNPEHYSLLVAEDQDVLSKEIIPLFDLSSL